MAAVYACLIMKGLKTIDDVPATIKDKVAEYLAAMEVSGYNK